MANAMKRNTVKSKQVERNSTLQCALELLAIASHLLAQCSAAEDDAFGDNICVEILLMASDDCQEIIGSVKHVTYKHEINAL